MRIDKWLWAARFFKTRALSARACELGRVEIANQKVKPARDLKLGDFVQVHNDSGDFTIEVLQFAEMRGPAPVAQTLYRETEESKQARAVAIERRKTLMPFEIATEGRPSKRDRRDINRLRGRA